MYLLLVTCLSLTAPTNGMISCSLGGNNIHNPGESCTFTCNSNCSDMVIHNENLINAGRYKTMKRTESIGANTNFKIYLFYSNQFACLYI